MTIVVLGFDALEHKMVEELKLKELKQKSYTKLDVSDFPIISTPPLWASMLTGKIDERIISHWVPEYQETESAYNLGIQLVRKLLPSKIRDFLNEFIRNKFYSKRSESPLKATLSFLQDTNTSTIFSGIDAWHNEIPGYNAEAGDEKMKRFKTFFDGTEEKLERKATMELIKEQYEEQTENLIQALENKDSYDLIFWYTKYLDEIGHMDRGSKLRTIRRYMKVNQLVGKVRDMLSSKDKLYIISDHGMRPKGKYGLHDKDAFFSSSDGNLIEKPRGLYELVKNKISS